MKLTEIKKSVFNSLKIKDTKQLKKKYPNLVKGLDLRTKIAWEKIELVITEEADSSFQQVLSQMEQENQDSNRIIQNALNDWETFKNQVIAESEAEDKGKLSHLSDYRPSKDSSKISKQNGRSKTSNLVNFKK